MDSPQDPFRESREKEGVHYVEAEGEQVPLILRHNDVRDVCRDWKTFSSDDPFMIVLHSEEHLRPVRQLPIETDPPDQKEYRALIEPLFRRPLKAEYREDMQALVDDMVREATQQDEVEAVGEFSKVLQCRALTRLLDVNESEAQVWIGWGTHVFEEGDGSLVDEYVRRKFAEAEGSDGDDFFSVLNRVEFRGRRLTNEEKYGFASVTFAGGRDTIIHTVSSILVYLAGHPEALPFLREDESRITTATEEFVRWVSPLTAIARKCPHGGEAVEHEVPPDGRVALCWPSANRDEKVFENPDEVVLDRSPNPHIGYGFGIHHCLGAPHARVIISCLLKSLCKQVERIELLEAAPQMEHESSYDRQVGYATARVAFHAM
jgi:cytochrome P450